MKIFNSNFVENSENIFLGGQSFDLLKILKRFNIYDDDEKNNNYRLRFWPDFDDIYIKNEIFNPDLIALFLTDFFKKNINKYLARQFLNYLNKYKDNNEQSFFKTIEKRTEIFNSILNNKKFVEVQRWCGMNYNCIKVSLLDDIKPAHVEIVTDRENSLEEILAFLNNKELHNFNNCRLKISFKEENRESLSNIPFHLTDESLNYEKRNIERFLKLYNINNIDGFFDKLYGLDTDFISNNNDVIINVPYTEVKSSESEIIW